MTRWLEGKEIPKFILTPANPNMQQESRRAIVYGISILDTCLNSDCAREGPMDALLLGPLNLWPNIVVICGDEGCGVHWAMVGDPPQQTRWIQDLES